MNTGMIGLFDLGVKGKNVIEGRGLKRLEGDGNHRFMSDS
jgi:hypothetical protein